MSAKNDLGPIEILKGAWLDIAPHAERGAVFVVSGDLDLTDVANRVAADDVDVISRWISDESIRRPTPPELLAWSTSGAEKTFRFAIVQPYVLIQDHGH